jgi:hypothetical protein
VYALLGCYALFCVVIGGALGYHEENAWIVVIFFVAGFLGLQLGFFTGLLLTQE